MTDTPLPLLVLPLLASIITIFSRKNATISALVAASVPAAAAVFVLVNPLANPLSLLGRELSITTSDRFAIAYIYLCAAATFLGVWRTSPRWTYYPAALVVLTAVAAALGARPITVEVVGGRPFDPFNYSVLFLTIAALLSIFPLQGGLPGVSGGTLRYMTFMILAVLAFLTAAWVLDQYSQSPDAVNLAQTALALLLLGLTLWLAVIPFHSWVPGVASESPPLSSAFVLGVINVAAWFLMLDMMNEIKLLHDSAVVYTVFRILGVLTTIIGGVLAFAQNDWGRLMGYAVLADIGVALVAFSAGTIAGLSAALFVVFLRTFGLGLMSMGLALARERLPDDTFVSLSSLAWRKPWAAVVLIVGALSLAGVPPLAGFPGRWAALQQVAGNDFGAAAAMLIGTIGVVGGTLRGLQFIMRPSHEPLEDNSDTESLPTIALLLGALGLCLLFGMFPDLITPIVRQMALTFSIAP